MSWKCLDTRLATAFVTPNPQVAVTSPVTAVVTEILMIGAEVRLAEAVKLYISMGLQQKS